MSSLLIDIITASSILLPFRSFGDQSDQSRTWKLALASGLGKWPTRRMSFIIKTQGVLSQSFPKSKVYSTAIMAAFDAGHANNSFVANHHSNFNAFPWCLWTIGTKQLVHASMRSIWCFAFEYFRIVNLQDECFIRFLLLDVVPFLNV